MDIFCVWSQFQMQILCGHNLIFENKDHEKYINKVKKSK